MRPSLSSTQILPRIPLPWRVHSGSPAKGEAGGWGFVFALAVGEGKFWVRDLFAVRDSNPEIGLDFRFVLLEIALAKQIPCM